MAEEKIEIEILLETQKLIKGFNNVEKQAKPAGKKAGDGFESGFKSGLGSLKTALLGLGAVLAAAFGGRKVIEAAVRQEDAINTLNNSLRSAGTFSEEASQSFQDFASELQKVSTVGDEATLEMAALARNFTQTNEEAQKLTKAAVELSAATGLSLEGSVKNLGKTFAGLTGELGESVPALRALTKEQLIAGEALDLILERFGGSAASKIETFSGAIAQLSNVFGDVLEEIGLLIIQSPALVATITFISNKFLQAGDAIKKFGEGDPFGSLLKRAILFAEGINTFVIAPLELVFNTVKVGFSGIQTVFQGLIFGLANIALKFVSFFSPEGEMAQTLRLFVETSGEILDEFALKTSESVGGIFNFDLAASSAQFIEELKNVTSNAEAITEDSSVAITKTLVSVGVKAAEISVDIGKVLLTGINTGLQAVGRALVQGENGFAAFGKAILATMGDFAIQVGGLLIAIGFSLEKLKESFLKLDGFSAVAAGAALIVLGGALKAMSGGPAATATQTVATAPATPDFVGDSEDPFDPTSDLNRGTAVTVNVEGTIMDPVATATQIAELLREVTDSNDIQVNA